MSETKLTASARTEFGKGAARRIRRAHQIPAVVYGHGEEPLHITLPGHETMLALKHANALLAIDLDGSTQLAIAKDVQRDPVKNVIEHVDLLAVRKGEKISVEVPVHVVGEAAGGALAMVESQTLHVEAEATHLPEGFEVSVEGLEAGASVTAGEVALPSGVTLLTDPETAVVVLSAPQVDEGAAEGEAEAESGAAEPAEAAEEAGEEA
ncbi:50S ribosomal protein L25/general stress protein Ctc [Actinotalea sp. AC32]|nr:50S ribosomal protein L25/general stress protein Ctc [Actinotalea sp. AC32]